MEISVTLNGRSIDLRTDFRIPLICTPNSRQKVKFVVVNRSNEPMIFSSYKHGYKAKIKKVDIIMKDQHKVGQGRQLSLQPSRK